jgi:hypothetical protein
MNPKTLSWVSPIMIITLCMVCLGGVYLWNDRECQRAGGELIATSPSTTICVDSEGRIIP